MSVRLVWSASQRVVEPCEGKDCEAADPEAPEEDEVKYCSVPVDEEPHAVLAKRTQTTANQDSRDGEPGRTWRRGPG